MVRANEGHVVTVASMAGENGTAGLSEYCASKFAVRGLHDAILKEMHVIKSDVKCTVVCPYMVSTGMIEGAKMRYATLSFFGKIVLP